MPNSGCSASQTQDAQVTPLTWQASSPSHQGCPGCTGLYATLSALLLLGVCSTCIAFALAGRMLGLHISCIVERVLD